MSFGRRWLGLAALAGLGLLAGFGQDSAASRQITLPAVPGTTKGAPEEKNDLRTIVIYYKSFELERGRPPNTIKEFTDYIKRDAPLLEQGINKQHYIVMVKRRPLSSTIIAFQNAHLIAGHSALWGARTVGMQGSGLGQGPLLALATLHSGRDFGGKHVVVLGDATIQELSTAELISKLGQQGK